MTPLTTSALLAPSKNQIFLSFFFLKSYNFYITFNLSLKIINDNGIMGFDDFNKGKCTQKKKILYKVTFFLNSQFILAKK